MNKERDFDLAALSWDEEPRRVRLARNVTGAIIETLCPDRTMDVLDFGCGTGLVTLQLHPLVRHIVGVDSSQGMLSVLDQKIRERAITNVDTLWCNSDMDKLLADRFHLVISSMTLHHVPEPAKLFTRFFDLLVPGGTIGIADLDAEDGNFHDNPAGVYHHGFHREGLTALLMKTGFVNFKAMTADVIVKGEAPAAREYPVFLVTACRPK